MNLDQFKVRAALTEGIGRDMEKSLEEAQIEVIKFQGAYEALLQIRKELGDRSVLVRDDLFNGKIVLDRDDPMAVAKYVVGKIQEMVAFVHEKAENANLSGVAAQGKVNGLLHVVKHMKGLFDSEVSRIKMVEAQIASGEVVVEDGVLVHVKGERVPGVHPGPSLKQIRMEEEWAAQPEKSQLPPSEPENIAQSESPVKKTRAKRRKV